MFSHRELTGATQQPRMRSNPTPRQQSSAPQSDHQKTSPLSGNTDSLDQQTGGVPTPAGINPEVHWAKCRCVGRPHACGDKPQLALTSQRRKSASPQTRGSTGALPLAGHRCRGRPAPAGLHRDPQPAAQRSSRFPRTSGAPPGLFRFDKIKHPIPPHPRGYTDEKLFPTIHLWDPPQTRG